jgi:putative transposase
MTTHYHLILEARTEQLSTGMQLLNGRYALGFNRRHGRYGALFAERYSIRVVESEEHLFEACAYVVLNPVKAGLCDYAGQWRWSYSAYGLETA